MSRRLIDLSADLLKLQNDGYDIVTQGGFLLVRDVPYVNSNREVKLGILISKLELSGDITNKPKDHVAYWTGEHPCHNDGRKITAIQNGSAPRKLYNGVQADFTFSAKADYRDYYHKMTSYMARINGEATKIDSNADARTYPVIPTDDDETSPFKYVDTATCRAGIATINNKIVEHKIGIVGLGGTGSYILDLVTKTEVAEIRIIDGDVFSQHNAFRSPGAPTQGELREKPKKVHRFKSLYSNMHKRIVAHEVFLDDTNMDLIDGLDFVFICIDSGPTKKSIIEHLIANETPFVEVGIGVNIIEDKLRGNIRVVTSTPQTREAAAPYISYSDESDEANEYATNIQIAELNSLNAVMAVIQWKKLFGIYQDFRNAFCTGYSISSGEIANEDANEGI